MLLIPCDKCTGKGTVPLPDVLQRTLRAIKANFTTAEKIHAQDPDRLHVGIPAVNKRLEKLRALGLVQRHREGKFFIYSPTSKGRNFK